MLIQQYPELFRGGHILDIGANIGYCSMLFSRAIDPGRKVIAFEPEPFNVALLKDVAKSIIPEKLIVIEAAVGDREGEIRLEINPRHHGDHRVLPGVGHAAQGESVTVPLVTVDSILARHDARTPVCFIKVDVQGFELAVCEGCRGTLESNPDCVVVLEYMPEALEALGFSPSDLPAWFERRGYRCYVLDKGSTLQEGPPPKDLGPRGYTDLLFSRKPIKMRSRP
jgi:FkbM family methyltransferase